MQNFLDFFGMPDWFGRPEPYGFNAERIILLAICIFLCIFLPIKLKNNLKVTKKVLIGLWITALVIDIIKYIFYNAYCIKNNLEFSRLELPLWTCTIYLFVLPLSLFSKNQKVQNACKAFICSISMMGGFANFLFPTDSLFSFMGLHTFIYHFILFITPIIMLVTGFYKPELKHVKGAILIFIIYAIPVFIFDNIFQQDYMFIYDGTWFGPLADLARLMPHRLVWTMVSLLGHFAVATLMIYIESKIIQKIVKKNPTNQINNSVAS